MNLKIDNSFQAAIKSGSWKKPSVSFYNKLMDCESYQSLIDESFLIVGNIKNSPQGRTSFAQSGCRYPHHTIHNGKLVVSIPGIKAAYSRAKQMGTYKGDVKKHLEKHFREMGMKQYLEHTDCMDDPLIEENFLYIEKFIDNILGTNLVEMEENTENMNESADVITESIEELEQWIDRFVHDESFRKSVDYSDSRRIDFIIEESDPMYKDIISEAKKSKDNTGTRIYDPNKFYGYFGRPLTLNDLIALDNPEILCRERPWRDLAKALDGKTDEEIDLECAAQSTIDSIFSIFESNFSNADINKVCRDFSAQTGIPVFKMIGDKSTSMNGMMFFTTMPKELIEKCIHDDYTFKYDINKIGDMKDEHVILINYSLVKKIYSSIPDDIITLLMHEYGHVKTYNKISPVELKMYNIQGSVLDGIIYSIAKTLRYSQPEIIAVVTYYHHQLKLEKMADEASDIDVMKLIKIITGRTPRNEIGKIFNIDKFVSILAPTNDSEKELYEYTKRVYDECIIDPKYRDAFLKILETREKMKHISESFNGKYAYLSNIMKLIYSPSFENTDDIEFRLHHDLPILLTIPFMEGTNKFIIDDSIDNDPNRDYIMEALNDLFINGRFTREIFRSRMNYDEHHNMMLEKQIIAEPFVDPNEYLIETIQIDPYNPDGKYLTSETSREEIMDSISELLESTGSDILIPGVSTPAQLISYMDTIHYGWIGKNGEKYNDADDGDFFKDYALQSPFELIKSRIGVCWDQVEFERKWFSDNKYPFRTYFIVIDDGENKPSHTFLIYQKNHKVYWFENSWYDQRGIHVFNTLSDAIQEIFDKFNESHHNTSNDVYLYNLPEMPKGIGCEEYYRIATDTDNLLKHVTMGNTNESKSEGLKVIADKDIKHPKYGYSYDFYTLTDNGTPVSEAKVLPDKQFVFDVETYPNYRRKGYAEYLVKYLIQNVGVRHLNVALDNKAAISLYKKIGFNNDGYVRGDNDEKLQRMTIDDDKAKKISDKVINESVEDPDISKPWFIKSDDGVDNCCIQVKGYDKPMRGRSAMITLKLEDDDKWYVLCKKNTDDYGVPGGGWNKNETPKHAAIRELHEEVLTNVKNVKRMGTLIEYHNIVKDWVKEHVPNKKDWWYGYYSAVFVGIYDGEFKGKVKEEDRETGYEWKKVDYSLLKKFPKEYRDAINQYTKDYYIQELGDEIDIIANEGWDVFEEKSHGLLKFDFRFARNVENGKLIKIVYDLNKNMIGNQNAPDKHTNASKWTHDQISNSGDKDHMTAGQMVLAIIEYDNDADVVDSRKGRKLKSVKCKGIFDRVYHTDKIFYVEVGKRDYQYSYKSTYAPKKHEIGVPQSFDIGDLITNHERRKVNSRGVEANNAVISYNIEKMLNVSQNGYKKIEKLRDFAFSIFRYDNLSSKFHHEINMDLDTLTGLLVLAKYNLGIHDEWKHRLGDSLYKMTVYELKKQKGIDDKKVDVLYQKAKKFAEENNIPFKESAMDNLFESNLNIFLEADDNPPSLDEDTTDSTTQEKQPQPEEDKNDQEELPDDNPPSVEDVPPTEQQEPTSNDEEQPAAEDTPAPQEQPPATPEEPDKDPLDEEMPEQPEEKETISRPKQFAAQESDKNGVRRKNLYIEFIKWCKDYNQKNAFGSNFDKDIFHITYPFVPSEMRYFYRLSDPTLCVLAGGLTFFPVIQLRKINSQNKQMDKYLIFAATESDLRVFNIEDKRVYLATERNGEITLNKALADTFDLYIQTMIQKGDILNAPLETPSESNNDTPPEI